METEGSRTEEVEFGGHKAFLILVKEDDATVIRMTSSMIDPHLSLVDPAGFIVANLHHASVASIDDSAFLAPGIYTVVAADWGGNHAGSFDLTWSGILSSAFIEVTSIIEPTGVVPLGAPVQPSAVFTNIGWEESVFNTTFIIPGTDYSDSLVDQTLGVAESRSLVFGNAWIPNEAAAFLTKCTTRLVDGPSFGGDEKTGMVSVTSGTGIGPEIHGRSPSEGPSSGYISAIITGSGFQNGMTASLEHAVEPDIFADSEAVQVVSATEAVVTFDLFNAENGLRDLRVTNPDYTTYVFYDGFEIVAFEGQEIPFGEWTEFSLTADTPRLMGMNVPADSDNLFILVKKTTHIGYSSTWRGSIRLMMNDREIGYVSGHEDFDIQIQNPEPGWYTLQVVSDMDGEGLVRASSDLDTLELGDWAIGEVLRPYGCEWMQLDIPVGVDILYFATDGFGLWSTLEVYSDYLDNHNTHWHFGDGYHIEGQIEHPQADRYYIRYTDSAVMQAGGEQYREFMIIADAESIEVPSHSTPEIVSLSTYSAGSSGLVTVDAQGMGFDLVSSAELRRSGHNRIAAKYVYVDDASTNLGAQFDFTGATPGQWEFWIVGPNNLAAKAPLPLRIYAGGSTDLCVEIVGRSQMRLGRQQLLSIHYANTGTIDAHDVMLWVTATPPISIELVGGEAPYGADPPQSLEIDGRSLSCALFPLIKVGQDGFIDIMLMPAGEMDIVKIDAGILERPPGIAELKSNVYKSTHAAKEMIIMRDDYLYNDSTLNRNIQVVNLQYYPTGPGQTVFIGPKGWQQYGHEAITDQLANNDIVVWDPYVLADESIPFEKWVTFYEQSGGRYLGYGTPDGWTPNLGRTVAEIASTECQASDFWHMFGFGGDRYTCSRWIEHLYEAVGLDPLPWSDSRFTFVSPRSHFVTMNVEGESWPGVLSWILCSLSYVIDLYSQWIMDQLWSPLATHIAEIVSSMTPEDKYGTPGYNPPYRTNEEKPQYIAAEQQIFYRTEFWNSENATAPVQEAFVVDTLSINLDTTTLNLTEVGFLDNRIPLEGGQYFNINIDLRPQDNLIVNIEGIYQQIHRDICWTFRALDPATMDIPADPSAGFLPPITDSGYEIGWVEFTVETADSIPSGTQITNQAFVNFDRQPNPEGLYWAPAPKDQPWLNTLDAGAPSSQVLSMTPTQGVVSFPVSVAGEDDNNGSGIARYEIYTSEDNEAYDLVGSTTGEPLQFNGEDGHTYKFYSVAVDNVGHREAAPADGEYDAITTVKSPTVMGVAPSPFVPSRGHTEITFFGQKVPNAVIKIFDKAGDLVKTLTETAGQTELTWDVKSRNDQNVASGVYIWALETPDGDEHRGKFAIIR